MTQATDSTIIRPPRKSKYRLVPEPATHQPRNPGFSAEREVGRDIYNGKCLWGSSSCSRNHLLVAALEQTRSNTCCHPVPGRHYAPCSRCKSLQVVSEKTPMRSLQLTVTVALVSIAVFSGCAKTSQNSDTSTSAPDSKYAIPTRAFLAKGQAPEDGLGAYGYVVFTRRPRPEETVRYIHACEAYQRTLEPSTAYPRASKQSLMVTHWLLTTTTPEIQQMEKPKCETLVDLYDFPRAVPIASSANIVGSEGPVLVAWATSYRGDSPTSSALVLDLSRFADVDFDRAFVIWKEKIVDDPSNWNDGGWKLVKVREAFRNLIQQYGEPIVTVIKPSGKGDK